MRIVGGADEFETAAIVAAVQHVLDTDAAATGQPPPRPVAQPWVLAGRVPPKPTLRRQPSGSGDAIRPPG